MMDSGLSRVKVSKAIIERRLRSLLIGRNPSVRFDDYPQWYDRFHERGYEVTRQTEDFDRIWVGTETRD